MTSPIDFAAAQAAVANAATSAADLAVIAQAYPTLHAAVAAHPAAYDGLLDWMVRFGDPKVAEVVASRRSAVSPSPTTPSAPAVPSPLAAPGAAQQNLSAQPTTQTPSFAAAVPAAAVPGQAMPQPGAAARVPTKKRGKWWVFLAIAVVVVALIATGIATRGFGLLGGGARTPEEEGEKLVRQAVELVNSFNASSLLKNPMTEMAKWTEELAPSERSLMDSTSALNFVEALGITGESIDWVADMAGSFTIEAEGIEARSYQLTDDIALVRLVGGTITVDADTAQLRETLLQTSGIVDQQILATAQAYGFDINIQPDGWDQTFGESLTESFGPDWVDTLVADIEENLPYTIDFAEQWQRMIESWQIRWTGQGETAPFSNLYETTSLLTMVRENGRWYWSSMLNANASSVAHLDVIDANKEWAEENADLLRDFGSYEEWLDAYSVGPEFLAMFDIEPASNATPAEAAEAMAQALSRGDARGLLRQLPLAERRSLALSGFGAGGGDAYLGVDGFTSTDGVNPPQFSEVSAEGGHALVRIESLMFWVNGGGVAMEDGSCFSSFYDSPGPMSCLEDGLAAANIGAAIDSLFYYDDPVWYGLNIDPYQLSDKLRLALETTLDSIDPDQVGLIAIEEDGSWHMSAVGTLAHLEGQLFSALDKGLAAARDR